MASAIAEDAAIRKAGSVDQLVEEMFFSLKARTQDPNLADVSRRVLESPIEGVGADEARSRILDLYRQVRDGRVRDDETDPVVAVLKLSGLITVLQGYLAVRNRVYFRAFDRAWVEANLPEGEALRQKRAARRAALRVSLLAGGVAVALSGLAIFGFAEARRADAKAKDAQVALDAVRLQKARADAATGEANSRAKSEEKAKFEAQRANIETRKEAHALGLSTLEAHNQAQRALSAKREADRQKTAALAAKTEVDRELYFSDVNLMGQAYGNNNVRLVQQILDETAQHKYDSLRGPEWGLFDRRVHTALATINPVKTGPTYSRFSPDGKYIATTANDHIELWDVSRRRIVRKIPAAVFLPNYLSFSPDSKRLLAPVGGGVRTDKLQDLGDLTTTVQGPPPQVRQWDIKTGVELAKFVGHSALVRQAEYSADGRFVATASEDHTARVWEAGTGRLLKALTGHTERVMTARFSPDGLRVVTSSGDKTVRIWDWRSGKEIVRMTLPTNAAQSAVFSPDGLKVLTYGYESAARLWDSRTGSLLEILPGTSGELVRDAEFSPEGRSVAIGGSSAIARVFDAETGKVTGTYPTKDGIDVVGFSPDGTQLLTGCADGSLTVWDRHNEIALLKIPCSEEVSSASFSPDGKTVLSACEFGPVRLWDSISPRYAVTVPQWADPELDISPDGTKSAGFLSGSGVLVSDLKSGKTIITLKGGDNVGFARFSPDGRTLVTIGDDKIARVWSISTGRMLIDILNVDNDAEISPNSKQLVTILANGTAAIFDIPSGRKVATVSGQRNVRSVAFSPDGRRVATIGSTITISDADTGQPMETLKGDSSGGIHPSFSPDGAQVVIASNTDNYAEVFDTKSGNRLTTLRGHRQALNSAVFTGDGRRIATTSTDWTLKLWDAQTGRDLATFELPEKYTTATRLTGNGLAIGGGGAFEIWPWQRMNLDSTGPSDTWAWKRRWFSVDIFYEDAYAWHWQMSHWVSELDAKDPVFLSLLIRGANGGNSEIASASYASILKHSPEFETNSRYQAEWKDLANLFLSRGDVSRFKSLEERVIGGLGESVDPQDVLNIAVAARQYDLSRRSYERLLDRIRRDIAKGSGTKNSISEGALLYRLGRFAESLEELKPAQEPREEATRRFLASGYSVLDLIGLKRNLDAKLKLKELEESVAAVPFDGTADKEIRSLIREAHNLLDSAGNNP